MRMSMLGELPMRVSSKNSKNVLHYRTIGIWVVYYNIKVFKYPHE